MTTRFFTWLRRFYDLPLFHAKRPRRRKPLKSIRKSLDFQRRGPFTVHVFDRLNRVRLSAFPRDTEALCNETPAR